MKRIDPTNLSNPIIEFKYHFGYRTGKFGKNYMSSMFRSFRRETYLHRPLRLFAFNIIKL